MSTKTEVTLVGAKTTDWKSEDGRHYDYVNLYGIIPLDLSQGNAVGQGVVEFKWQDSRNIVQLQGRQFPLKAILELDMVSTGKAMKQVLTNVILPAKQ
ncbi:MAG: hypothetical protein RR567_09115 [Carnobacterium sp.]|uniref:hypothetical protein n=1 Tax=Carnobacterium sp. TaxID=48221 RepID=UPI002FCA9185